MSAGFYERPSLNVESYDAIARDVLPGGDDLAFIATLAAETGGPLLELACGTGRLTIPLAEAAFEIVGLDRSAPMLDVARSKAGRLEPSVRERVRFVEADMTEFELPERFGLVFAVFRGFMLLLDIDSQRAALGAARRHLRPGGRLVLDLFDPRLDLLVPGSQIPDRVQTGPLPAGTVVEARPGQRAIDPVRQVFEEPWQFVERGGDGTVLREEHEVLTMRWTYRYEMRHLLTLAGFEDLHEFGDYAGGPPAYGAEQIWVARAPEDAE
jgi:SAM-dependent methyltransferase